MTDTTATPTEAPAETEGQSQGQAPQSSLLASPAADEAKAAALKEAAAKLELSFPEGYAPDAELLASYKATAAELGLDSAKAQKLAGLHVTARQAELKANEAAWAKQRAEWRAASLADKEVGGPEQAKNLALAHRAITKFGGPELVKAFDEFGIGDHPAFVRFMVRVGKALGEDSIASTAAAPPPEMPSAEQTLRALYPSMFAKE